MAKIVVDAGHGGTDYGATYDGRKEKDDNLRLALAVGEILENNGAEVVYTRTTDVYNTPFEKATMGNNADADYFVSIHRNAVPIPNTATGVETLVYQDSGIVGEIARNINKELANLGFNNRGVIERPNLAVLRRTRMPAVLVEAGFIDNESDNQKFDAEFDNIAQAIASGIIQSVDVAAQSVPRQQQQQSPRGSYEAAESSAASESQTSENAVVPSYKDYEGEKNDVYGDDVKMSSSATDRAKWPYENEEDFALRRPPYPAPYPPGRPCRPIFRVQVGAYRNYDNAMKTLSDLQEEGLPAFILQENDIFKVQAGAYQILENAIRLERRLRELGYNTYIITGC